MGRKYTLDLTNIMTDSHEKYYWLGFLAGDGSVAKNEARIRLELKDIDLSHLQKFQNFMGSNTPITERVNNRGCHAYTVNINSAELKRYVVQYNLIPNKTPVYTMPLDNIPQIYWWNLVRGLMNADGCIQVRSNRKNQPIISFVAKNQVCAEQMKQIWQVKNKIVINNGAYMISKEGAGVIPILNKMYENSTEESRLTRKYNIYRSLIE